MKDIKLTQGKSAIVDDEDFDRLNKFKWSATKHHLTWYAKRGFGSRINQSWVYMHRDILFAKVGEIVDHIDRDGLNNQRNNLRKCSHSQNLQNRRSDTGSASKFLGVCPSPIGCKKKWRGYIKPANCNQITKLFDHEVDAAKWYNDQANKYFGEFAYQNEI